MSLWSDSIQTARDLSLRRGKGMEELHPEIRDRVHLMTGVGAEAGMHSAYSYLNAINDYERHVWVRKAVLTIGNVLSALPLRVQRGKEMIDDHPVLSLLRSPNPKTNSAELWLQWTIDMELAGEEFWEVVRTSDRSIVELWARQPHVVSVAPSPSGIRYQEVDRYVIDDQHGPAYSLTPDDMTHFKFFNPRNPYRGISIVAAVRNAIVIDTLAQAWSLLFFKKSARPDYALIAPQGLTPKEREDLELKLEQKFGGVNQSHKPIVLEEGVSDIKILSFPPKDMEWLEQRGMSREEIGAIFGVPDEIMGWGRDTYENFATAERVLFTLTIQPIAGFRDISVTRFFQQQRMLLPDESVVTDWSGVSALQPDLSGKIQQAQTLFAMGYPQNTINARLGLGMPDIEGGDVGYLPFGLAPATATRSPARSILGKSSPRLKAPEYGSEEHKRMWSKRDRRLEGDRKALKKKLRDELERQRREVKRNLKSVRGIAIEDIPSDAEGKGISASDVFDVKAEIKRFKEQFLDNLKGAVGHAGQAEMDDLGIGMDFDLTRPEVQKSIETLLKSFAIKLNDTTYSGLIDLFRQAEQDGLSIPDIMDRLDDFFDGRRSEASLERIARTTMTGANGAADVLAWDQSGVVEEREWLSTFDDRTRDDHEDAHGQRVALDEPFEVGDESLDYPGDPNGSPENIINCRCSQIGIVSERAWRRSASRSLSPATRPALSPPGETEHMVDLIVAVLRAIAPPPPPPSPTFVLRAESVIIENRDGIQLDASQLPAPVIENHIALPVLPPPPAPTVINEITVPTPDVKVAVNNTVEAATITLPKQEVVMRRQTARLVRDALGRPRSIVFEDESDAEAGGRKISGEAK